MPYGFPTRFSFVIVFWLIAAAADAWGSRDKKSLVCGALVCLLLLAANGTMTPPAADRGGTDSIDHGAVGLGFSWF